MPSTLILVPFGEQPFITFDNVKLGHVAVRKLVIQNPNTKEHIQVCHFKGFLLWGIERIELESTIKLNYI